MECVATLSNPNVPVMNQRTRGDIISCGGATIIKGLGSLGKKRNETTHKCIRMPPKDVYGGIRTLSRLVEVLCNDRFCCYFADNCFCCDSFYRF